MTPFERYEAVLAGESVDYPPRIPIVMRFAAEYIGSDYAAFASDHRVLVEANVRCAEDFGFDQLSCISDPYRETAGFGAKLIYHRDGVPECTAPPLANVTNYAEVPIPNPHQSERMRDRLDAIKLYRKRCGDFYSVLGWVEGPAALAGDVCDLSEFLMNLMEEPERTAELLDLCTATAIEFARAQIDAGADSIGIGDAICSQISPPVYEELIWPRQYRLITAIKDAGAVVRLHICGQTQHLWSSLCELPMDIMDCDHMVDLAAARRLFSADLILAGNHDPVSDLRFGRPAEIRAKTWQCSRAAGGDRFMVNAGCEIPSGTPNENLRALCRPLLPT